MKQTDPSERLSWLLVAYAGIAFLAGVFLGRAGDCTTAVLAAVSALGVLVSAGVAAFEARTRRREILEQEEFEAFRREHGASELFENADERLRLVRRTRQQFVKFIVPGVAVVAGVALLIVSVLLLRRWELQGFRAAGGNPMGVATGFVLLFVLGLILGSYVNGASREEGGRWLRPAAQWVFLNALFFLAGAVVLIAENLGAPADVADPLAARVATVVLAVLGVELALGVVFEFYRPRVQGAEERPLLESRLLSLFTQPGGIARNFALALDYQFGFKVSDVWVYRFIERFLLPFAAIMVVALWALTCVTVVEAEENGIRRRFGAVVRREPLAPGLYLKLPWPLASIYTFPVERVQEIPIGYKPGSDGDSETDFDIPPDLIGDMTGRVILWSKAHNREETEFVTASERVDDLGQFEEGPQGGKPVPVYFISASVPLYFKVRNLYDYKFRHVAAEDTLREIATEEIVRYMVQDDLFSILHNLGSGGEKLREAIQSRANDLQLGVEIVFVGLQGIHPPVEVGAKFNDVVAAMEDKHRLILEAETNAIQRIPGAQAEAVETTTDAAVYSNRRKTLSEAEVVRFLEQLKGFRASPSMFALRNYLDLFDEAAGDLRKYVVAPFDGREVYIFNLEEKIRPDLLDVTLD